MASLYHLRTLLLAALNATQDAQVDHELFEQLTFHKQDLLKLYDVGPRNAQEQREIDSGKVLVNGRALAVNSDFARQVSFLSQQLECSERYLAGLLHHVMSSNPNISSEKCIEATILEYHLRRRQAVDCLELIFQAAQAADQPDSKPLHKELNLFLRQQLLQEPHDLPRRLLDDLDRLNEGILRVHVVRQNAKSNTVAPTAQPGQLGFDILSARQDSLKYERRTLATTVYLLARLGYLPSTEIARVIDWLQNNPHHAMTYYLLPTVLTSFDVTHPQSPGSQARSSLLDNSRAGLVEKLRPKETSTEWKEPGLKSLILLKWTLFITEARRRDPSLEERQGFRAEELESQVWNSVQGDCFTYMARTIAVICKRQNISSPMPSAAAILSVPDGDAQIEQPSEDFKLVVLNAFETLIRSLISNASSELRKIRQRQEDLLLASARTDRTRLFRSQGQNSLRLPSGTIPPADSLSSQPLRNDLATLFSAIGLLYDSLPPERALPFWGNSLPAEHAPNYQDALDSAPGKLPSFLQWAVWSTQPRDMDGLTALYDMLAGLAKGRHCSELTYNFLAKTSTEASRNVSGSPSISIVSWSAIFGQLEQWGAVSSNRPPQAQSPPVATQFGFSTTHAPLPQPQPNQQQLTLTQQDVLLAQSFLRLLSTVVLHSVPVRLTISGHARFRAIPTLVSLVPLSIPLELKGSIYDTLAAFCQPGAGASGIEICRSVWTLMERLEVINVRLAGSGSIVPSGKGVEVELEEVESTFRLYPATIPFLNLLSALIHTPKSIAARELVTDSEPLNTIPETLGHPYRSPGIKPYVSFVVDNVFLRISHREYIRPTDRWRINDLCLCFIERCLASFDLSVLLNLPDDSTTTREAVIYLALHPGFDIMTRMLTHSPLQSSILSYINDGLDGFEKSLAAEEPFFRSTITRVLRVVLRVLELQDIFLDVFIPLIGALEDTTMISEVHPTSYFVRLDQALSFRQDYIPSIVAYVSYPNYPELPLLSTRILSALSTSGLLTQLAVIIERSGDSERILDGFQNIIDVETLVDVESAVVTVEERTGAGAPEIEEVIGADVFAQATRNAALDFFIQNTTPDKTFPNVSHLLLFGKLDLDGCIEDPHAMGARRAAIHSILDLVNYGVSQLKGKGKGVEDIATIQPLLATLPSLAEKCYIILHQLCKHPRTSDFTMRYLRSQEDFFARHLSAIPFKAPPFLSEPFIEMQYNDSSRVITTVPVLASTLRVRSTIFELAALELHVLTNKGHLKQVSELLELLVGYTGNRTEDDRTNLEDAIFKPFHEVGQSHIRMLEFLQTMDFDWSDSLAVQPVPLEYLDQLNMTVCLKVDNHGCEIIDREALISSLTAAHRDLRAQGRILTPTHLQQLENESDYILQSCVTENHRRTVQHGIATCYESWRRLLDITLAKCFKRVPQDDRESLLFDLLHALPIALQSSNIQESTAGILAEAILSVLTRLREDRHVQALSQSGIEAGMLPSERLYTLLRSLIDCTLSNGWNERVRGNLYASLVNYIHLIIDSEGALPTSLLQSSISSELLSRASLSVVPSGASTKQTNSPSLITGSIAILKPVAERLISHISRDSTDGTEVWKTIAFILLDSFVRLFAFENQPAILNALSRPGFIYAFVQSLKSTDPRLQAILKPDPDEMNTLFVYESKMSLLIQVALNPQGAERLLEARLIPVLAEVDFIDARPEADQAFFDRDNFLPSAIQRYHQLLIPALQVVSSVLITLGPKHTTAANQVLDLLASHRDTVLLLLKNEVDDLSISVLEEIRLLVSLSANVYPHVQKIELLSSSGFGGIHAAILHAAAKVLGNKHWSEAVKPVTDEEIDETTIPAPGHQNSKFRVKVHRKERDLRKAIVQYLGVASNFADQELVPVFSPVVMTARQDVVPSRFLATSPTIGDAIDALDHIYEDLQRTLKQFLDVSELELQDHNLANIAEIMNISTSTLGSLEIGQKQTLIQHELRKWQSEARASAQGLFQTLEMLLLLLWRHLAIYAEDGAINVNVPGAALRTPSYNPETFRSETARKLGPILHRLSTLGLENAGFNWQSYQKYMDVMASRLKDMAGLDGSSHSSESEAMIS